jgi:hypothetical protein
VCVCVVIMHISMNIFLANTVYRTVDLFDR